MSIFVIAIFVLSLAIFERYYRNHLFETSEQKKIGDNGEQKVRKILSTLPPYYSVENDVHIGGCQIDHIVYCKDIIIVIETKNWGGTIYTNQNRYWKQYKNGNISMLYNPIRQNAKHTSTVASKQPYCKVYGIICFVGNARLVGACSRSIVKGNELRNKIFDLTSKAMVDRIS